MNAFCLLKINYFMIASYDDNNAKRQYFIEYADQAAFENTNSPSSSLLNFKLSRSRA
jgi:hypothetical protein